MAKATPIRGLSAGTGLRAAASRILGARLRDLQRQEAGLPEVANVHDMRVAARRLRAALRLFQLRELEADVKKLQDALGSVRDLQLQLAWLHGRDELLAARRKAALPRAKRTLAQALLAWRTKTLPRVLAAAESKFRGTLSGGEVRKLLRARLLRCEERMEAALRRPSPPAMHAVRRSAKQLRYLFELTQPAFPSLSKALLAELLPLQASLGVLHDVDVRIALLRPGPLLREQKEYRQRLAAIATAELSRWQTRKVARRARRALR